MAMGCIPKKTSRQVLQSYSLCKGWLPDNYLKIIWQLPDKLSVKLFPKKFHEIFCKTVPEIVLDLLPKIQTRPHPCYILKGTILACLLILRINPPCMNLFWYAWLLIFRKNSPLHVYWYWSCTFINFEKKFPLCTALFWSARLMFF